MKTLSANEIPAFSRIGAYLPGADFWDAYAALLADGALTPTEIFLRASRAAPRWVSRAMSVRNAIVRRLGLKDVGSMEAADSPPRESYQVGDRLGIFTVMDKSEGELFLGIDDSHLDVRVSVLKSTRPGQYVVATVVKVHNWLGHLYMLPVGRIHPFVVRAMMRRARV